MKRVLNATMMFSCNIHRLAQHTIAQTTHKTNIHINRNNIPMKFPVRSLVESGHMGGIGQVLLNART